MITPASTNKMQKHHTIILFTSFGASILSIILIAVVVYLALASKTANGELISRPVTNTNLTTASTTEKSTSSTGNNGQEYTFSGIVSETGDHKYHLAVSLYSSTEPVYIEVTYSGSTLFSTIDTTNPPLPGSGTIATAPTTAEAIQTGMTLEVITDTPVTKDTVSVAAEEIHQLQ